MPASTFGSDTAYPAVRALPGRSRRRGWQPPGTLAAIEFLNDSFTDTNGTALTSHVGEVGANPWTLNTFWGGVSPAIQNNRIYTTTDGMCGASGIAPSGSDYDVTATFTVISQVANRAIYILGRGVTNQTNWYQVGVKWTSGSAGTMAIVRLLDGFNGLQLDIQTITGLTVSSQHTVTLRMRGKWISMFYDGVQMGDAVLDTAITRIGIAGVALDAGSSTTGLHIDSITATTPSEVDPVGVWVTPTSNLTVAMGDSETDNWSNNSYQPWLGASYLPLLTVQTMQRMQYLGIYATGGFTAQQVRATHLPQVLALNPPPGAAILHLGTNNTGSEQLAYAAQRVEKDMMVQLMAAGIMPIMTTIGPHDENPSITQYAIMWNDWARGYAKLHNFPLIDAWAAFTNPGGTTFKAGYTPDGLHYNPVAYEAMVNQAITDGVPNAMPVNDPTVFTARTLGDLTNMIGDGSTNLGMFSGDSNADGVSDGFTTSGQALLRSITSGWTPGDTLKFGCRVKTQNITSLGVGYYLQVRLTVPSGFTYPDGGSATLIEVGAFNWLFNANGLLYVEFVVPPGTTAIEVRATLASGTVTFSRVTPAGGDNLAGMWQRLRNNANGAQLDIGELTLRNLTPPPPPVPTLYPPVKRPNYGSLLQF